ncbi:Piso0_000919 [Millerozyma farinosa CBS 7064]|uniref:Small ribosomal subunit protein mS38 n=1 Tax=Pichia sorbitophila (strain ATCC MYA-4447 / BCRC 22081 / CBS 7064 / NBRC 10061 / NRRL Y-12695) TaxID=559304 RepID=G8YRW2_PICSO|nr:Piso0_000919 [Millerozyma farinosa CBS 7064]
MLRAFGLGTCIGKASSRLLSLSYRHKGNPIPSIGIHKPVLMQQPITSSILNIIQKPQGSIMEYPQTLNFEEEVDEADATIHLDSVLRKRRLKMKKHKLRKRRREQRALKKRLGKI